MTNLVNSPTGPYGRNSLGHDAKVVDADGDVTPQSRKLFLLLLAEADEGACRADDVS